MAAPPGFDPTASVLPDPGASSAPIHVMRGGGMKGGDRTSILTAYKLGPGQELDKKFSEEEKDKFIAALSSGGCSWTTKSVLDAKCAPVVNVLKTLLKQKIKSVNAATIPEDIKVSSESSESWLNKLTKGLKTTPAPKEVPDVVNVDIDENQNNDIEVEMSAPLTGLNAIAARARAKKAARSLHPTAENSPFAELNTSVFENEPEENIVLNETVIAKTNTVNSPTNWKGNRARRSANLKLNLTRKNKRIYSNFNINSKPVRIYGNSPSNIAKRYNAELAKSQKMKKGMAKADMGRVLREQENRFKAEKEKRSEAERVISEQRKANMETQRRKVAENAARAAEARRIKKEQEEKLLVSQKRAANARAAAAAAEKEQEELEIASGIRKPAKPGFFTRAKGMFSSGKKGGSRKNRRTTRRSNRK